MKLEKMSLVCLALCKSALTAALGATPSKSFLKPVDVDQSIYAYVDGSDGISASILSARKSETGDQFVVFVGTTDAYYSQATSHAVKLANWFEKNLEDVSNVPVVVFLNEKGVGYSFHMNGLGYKHKEHAAEGVMNPQETVAALGDAKLEYQAILALSKAGIRAPSSDSEFEDRIDYHIAKLEMKQSILVALRDEAKRQADEAFRNADEADRLLKRIQEM